MVLIIGTGMRHGIQERVAQVLLCVLAKAVQKALLYSGIVPVLLVNRRGSPKHDDLLLLAL